VDRVDDIIMSGGEKVSPSAVEDVMQQLDAIESIAVFGTSHDRFGEIVTAAVVRQESSIVEADIEAFCEKREDLAGYERPRRILFVDEFPRTGSGKINKVALAEQARDRLASDS
jgi:long-chain acyl-CoA synthetase